MGIFDKMKATSDEDEKIGNKQDKLKMPPVGVDKMEQLLMEMGVYYETEKKRDDSLLLEEPEWHFYDKSFQMKKCEAIEKKLMKLEGKEPNLKKDVRTQQSDIKKLRQEQLENDKKIEMYKRSLRVIEQPLAIMGSISRLEERNKAIAYEIEQDYLRTNDLRVLMKREGENVKDLYAALIVALAHLPENHLRCRSLAMQYDIENSFTKLALRAIQCAVEGDKVSAVEYAAKYFEKQQGNTEVEHTHLLDELYTNYLFLKKDFKKAKSFVERLVYYAPEQISYHEMLRKIHIELDEKKQAQIEEKVIALLS